MSSTDRQDVWNTPGTGTGLFPYIRTGLFPSDPSVSTGTGLFPSVSMGTGLFPSITKQLSASHAEYVLPVSQSMGQSMEWHKHEVRIELPATSAASRELQRLREHEQRNVEIGQDPAADHPAGKAHVTLGAYWTSAEAHFRCPIASAAESGTLGGGRVQVCGEIKNGKHWRGLRVQPEGIADILAGLREAIQSCGAFGPEERRWNWVSKKQDLHVSLIKHVHDKYRMEEPQELPPETFEVKELMVLRLTIDRRYVSHSVFKV